MQARNFQAQQLLANYQLTVVSAVEEVDNALGNYAADQDSLAQLGSAVDASKRAAALAQQRYNNGLTDFLNVLDAQRQLYALEDQYAVALDDLIRQYVALYKALGGGWEGYEGAAPRGPAPGDPRGGRRDPQAVQVRVPGGRRPAGPVLPARPGRRSGRSEPFPSFK